MFCSSQNSKCQDLAIFPFTEGWCSVPNPRIGCSCQFGQKILEALFASGSQTASHILRMWRLIKRLIARKTRMQQTSHFDF